MILFLKLDFLLFHLFFFSIFSVSLAIFYVNIILNAAFLWSRLLFAATAKTMVYFAYVRSLHIKWFVFSLPTQLPHMRVLKIKTTHLTNVQLGKGHMQRIGSSDIVSQNSTKCLNSPEC